MRDAFRVRLAVRGYETDANGHVAGAVLLQYGQHARWECLRAAGAKQGRLLDAGIGPISLEETIRNVQGRAGDSTLRWHSRGRVHQHRWPARPQQPAADR
ncbi:acyl-CoA thioesterase [Tamaricihabitans halophyticus]|uniref:acyl-CoA thioesterase n=1 Tax=Tamaricihabitans halophyticus TaxID=1262583 RepID=UPI003C7173DE